MICEINKRTWVIREVPERILIKQIQKYEEGRVIMANGLTNFQKQIIEINQEIDEEVKRHTLLHELMHAYLRTFITWDSLTDITEEQMCDISANAHDIIHEIVENYFKEKRNYDSTKRIRNA